MDSFDSWLGARAGPPKSPERESRRPVSRSRGPPNEWRPQLRSGSAERRQRERGGRARSPDAWTSDPEDAPREPARERWERAQPAERWERGWERGAESTQPAERWERGPPRLEFAAAPWPAPAAPGPPLPVEPWHAATGEEQQWLRDHRIEANPACRPLTAFAPALPPRLCTALDAAGYAAPLPVQAVAIPAALAGKDVLGIAQTGSGKTLAYLLPALARLPAARAQSWPAAPRVLVVGPTRELAVQIRDEASKLGAKACALYGGEARHVQARGVQGMDLLTATPGRLVDFVALEAGGRRVLSLHQVAIVVLDEADRMLDLGFREEMVRICALTRPDRQTLFFSATWPESVRAAAAALCVGDRVELRVGAPEAELSCRASIAQDVVVVDEPDWALAEADKKQRLEAHVAAVLAERESKLLVFVATKAYADELANKLWDGGVYADAMHSGKSQQTRLRVLEQFREGRLRTLVCTDVMQRGLDIPSVSHVVIFEMPGTLEDYVHRIGRTSRGEGASGHALVFFEFWRGAPQLAKELIALLQQAGQPVPAALEAIAADVDAGRRGGWELDERRRAW